MKTALNNEHGFVLLFIGFLLPVGITLLLLMAAWATVRLEYSRQMHICRESVLEVEAGLAKKLRDLIKLNPQAERLRSERKIAEAAAAAGKPIPGVNIATEVYKDIVIARQILLSAKQAKLIYSATREAREKLGELRLHLGEERASYIVSPISETHSFPFLAVQPTPKFTLSPNYEPLPGFERLQAVSVRVTFRPKDYLPPSLERAFTKFGLVAKNSDWGSFSSECSATIEEEDGEWFAKLGKGRFLSSWSSASLSRSR